MSDGCNKQHTIITLGVWTGQHDILVSGK